MRNNANTYTRRFWAKSDRTEPARIHLLDHHLADVGACFEALLGQPTIRQRLARSGGRDALDDATAARLCVFAALHDIGKVNVGFQTIIWTADDLPPGQRRMRAGHTDHLMPVLTDADYETAGWFFDALGWDDDFLAWDDRDGETVCGLLLATLSHHGRPLQLDNSRVGKHTAIWRPYGELNPQEFVAGMGRRLREWFPAAFAAGGLPLPSAPEFQHHFLGLCNLADWIGSNERWFGYDDTPDEGYIVRARESAQAAVNAVGLNLAAQRAAFAGAGVPDVGNLFDFASPNAIQQAAQDTPLAAPVVIIESETGSGKTEAALWRFARMYAAGLVDGMYFALPTRAAAVQIHGRVAQFIRRLFPDGCRPPVVLAVPGYQDDNPASAAVAIPEYPPGPDYHDVGDKPWASESPKRFLAAQIAVGTVDQALLGALQVKNAHLRTSSLARNLLVVDEVHASDVYMGVVLQRLLAAHTGAGGHALLMSATLGAAARERWLGPDRDNPATLDDAILTAYPAVSTASGVAGAGENGQDKTVQISATPQMRDFPGVARRALDAARAGAKVLVVRNTVGHAVNTQQEVAELAGDADAGLLFAVKNMPTLHHGRFAPGDRRRLDNKVETLLGKDGKRPDGGVIVVGTQTLEQSLDIDADLLITDLCPADVLLQRIGRLHRHRQHDASRPPGYRQPTCIVLTPPDGNLAPLLKTGGRPANGLGPHGHVYPSLHILEATRRLIDEHPQWSIPAMNRQLVEGATHLEALDMIAESVGGDPEYGDAWIEHANSSQGINYSDAQHAEGVVIQFGKRFYPDHENRLIIFAGNDENIRTRLGDERVEIAFKPPPASPFDGAPIAGIAMPLRWLRGATAPEAPVTPEECDGGFEFAICNRRFRYDCLGLQQA